MMAAFPFHGLGHFTVCKAPLPQQGEKRRGVWASGIGEKGAAAARQKALQESDEGAKVTRLINNVGRQDRIVAPLQRRAAPIHEPKAHVAAAV